MAGIASSSSSLGESSSSQSVASCNVSAAKQEDDELSEAVQLEVQLEIQTDADDSGDEGTNDIESYSSASSEHARDPLDGSSNEQETANIAFDSTNKGNFLVSYVL